MGPPNEVVGLYYFRNRYYAPSEGRFVQRDPVWDAANVGGQYSFAGSGPLSDSDPLGTQNLRRQLNNTLATRSEVRKKWGEGNYLGAAWSVAKGVLNNMTMPGGGPADIVNPGAIVRGPIESALGRYQTAKDLYTGNTTPKEALLDTVPAAASGADMVESWQSGDKAGALASGLDASLEVFYTALGTAYGRDLAKSKCPGSSPGPQLELPSSGSEPTFVGVHGSTLARILDMDENGPS
ncbi:MAG: hypothetical protein KC492_40375, partial [Myxococcales bacterium]|nr:hypothetical protein [Myxococcales bacterium]